MQLLSINDLNQPQEALLPLIQEAQGLAAMWKDFVAIDDETHSYEVVDFGESGRAPGFHASEMSGCFKRLVYAKWGTEKQVKTTDVNMKFRFKLGTAVHALVQSDLVRMCKKTNGRIQFEPESRISAETSDVARVWGISSSSDGIFTFNRWVQVEGTNVYTWVPYMRVGLEIKTASHDEFTKYKEPKEEHKNQTNLYMRCLDLPLMWTLYYNKNNSNITDPMAPWLFQFDFQRWSLLEQRMSSTNYHIMTNQLPAKEEGMHCRWCPYSWHCQPAILKAKTGSGNFRPTAAPGLRAPRSK